MESVHCGFNILVGYSDNITNIDCILTAFTPLNNGESHVFKLQGCLCAQQTRDLKIHFGFVMCRIFLKTYNFGVGEFAAQNLQVNARFVPSDVRGLQLLHQDDDYSNEKDKVDLRKQNTYTLCS